MSIKIIGITGLVGSGKSTVAQIIKDKYGAHLLTTDTIAHTLMKKNGISYQLICGFFGDLILDDTGEIDRSKLGQIVFQDPLQLEELNSMVHPFVMNCVIDEIRKIKKEQNDGFILIESAIIIETGYKEICDEIWYVSTPNAIRRERLKKSRGYSEEKIDSILRNQLSEEEFLKNSTKTIHNSGEIEDIMEQIELLLV